MAMFELRQTGRLQRLMAGVQRAERDLDKLVGEAMLRAGERVVTGLQDASPKGTGRTGGHLSESFRAEEDGLTTHIWTSESEKYHWVTEGTSTPIRPTHARMLASPELPHPMAWVRGQKPNPFAQDVFDHAAVYVQEEIDPLGLEIARVIESG